jgi:hypothetical protein
VRKKDSGLKQNDEGRSGLSYGGICESRIPFVRASVNEARCSVRSTTGADKLMCSGSWAPRSLCKRLCRRGVLVLPVPATSLSMSSDRSTGH